MSKRQTFIDELAARAAEIEHYQINIDNYRMAIEKIQREHSGSSDMDKAMQQFAGQLEDLLRTSLVEQRKTQIIREVIAEQFAAMEG